MSISKIGVYAAILALVIGFISLGIADITHRNQQLRLQNIKLKDTTQNLTELKSRYDGLTNQLNQASKDKKVNQQKIEQLQKEKKELQKKTTG